MDFAREPIIFNTEQDFDAQMQKFTDTARELLDGAPALKVAGGLKGVYDHESGRIGKTPGKEGWTWQPFAERVATHLGVKPLVYNDTAIVGIGEAHAGAGVGSERLVYLSVSTGIGGVQIVHGNVVDTVYGFEPGHQIIDYKTGDRLEALVGGAALEARSGMKPIDIHDTAVWEREAEILAIGVHNSVLHWSPDRVVLGGSMMKGVGVEGIELDRVVAHIEKYLTIFPKRPEFCLAKLGQYGGLYGAMIALKRAG